MKKILIIVFIFSVFNNLSAQNQNNINRHKDPTTYEESEIKLKEVYDSVIKILAKDDKKSFIKSQKDWLKYRESECEFELTQVSEKEKEKGRKEFLFDLNKRRIQDLMASFVIIALK